MRQELGRFHSGALVSLTLRVGAASAVMAAVCIASTRWLLPGWESTGFWLRLAWLMGTIVVASAAFALRNAAQGFGTDGHHRGVQAPPESQRGALSAAHW